MFEAPLKQDGNLDINALNALIRSVEEKISSIERQKETAPEASIASLDAQKSLLERELYDLKNKLDLEIGAQEIA